MKERKFDDPELEEKYQKVLAIARVSKDRIRRRNSNDC